MRDRWTIAVLAFFLAAALLTPSGLSARGLELVALEAATLHPETLAAEAPEAGSASPGVAKTSSFFIAPIVDWNNLALDTTRAERLGAAPASRLYAMVNIAIYDAVNGIDVARGISTREAALVGAAGAPLFASKRAAASAAAHAVLSALYPDQAALYDAQLAADLRFPFFVVAAGANWGSYVGQQVVTLRSDDGSSPTEVQPGDGAAGEFRADFTSAQYRNLRPFGIASAGPYRSPGPPALDSQAYADALNEVKDLGNAAVPDPGKDEIFLFWKGGGGSARPPGEWIKVALVLATEQPSTRFSLSRTARLFALLGMALGDSTATAWDSKFVYHFWRPATAIQNADSDGNPATLADPSWAPRNGSIGGSPEHTSGQSTYAGSGSTILAGFFCRDAIAFSFEGDNAIAGPRQFSSFSEAAAEAGRARIFAGIHFEFSNQAGQAAGRGVGEEILANRLLRGQGPTHLFGCPL